MLTEVVFVKITAIFVCLLCFEHFREIPDKNSVKIGTEKFFWKFF